VSGWAVVSVIGAVLAAGIVAILVWISRAVVRTAENARELIIALEQVQANTVVLADLEAQTEVTARVAADATQAFRQLHEQQSQRDGHDPDGA
jgi:uncharacterized membrane protein YccC